MKISFIFTTYNSPAWLEKVLWGLKYQSHKDFEVIIADDGSNEENVNFAKSLIGQYDFPIRHIWHEDNGFQKCRILNKAILEAKYDYIIFTDGDCILRSDFMQTHIDAAEKGYFLTGTYVKLPMHTSKVINEEDVKTGRCFTLDWLRKNGYKNSKGNLKLTARGKWASFLNKFTTANANFMGANSSAWKQDLLDINGFDERMQYGGLDREIGVRLKNKNIKAKRLRFSAICVHLDHSRGYKDPKLVAQNKAIRVYNEKNAVTTTEYGISQLNDND